MQVLCRSSHSQADIRCPVCHQPFALRFSRTSPAERARAQHRLLAALAAHHTTTSEPHAHPRFGFSLDQPSAPAFAWP